MKTWEVFLSNYHAKGENGPRGRARRHWRQTARDKKIARNLIFATHKGTTSDPLPKFVGEVTCEYVRYRTSGPDMDEDNLSGSFKDLGDALESLGVVDNDRNIRLKAAQFRGKFKGTLIRITQEDTEMDPDDE